MAVENLNIYKLTSQDQQNHLKSRLNFANLRAKNIRKRGKHVENKSYEGVKLHFPNIEKKERNFLSDTFLCCIKGTNNVSENIRNSKIFTVRSNFHACQVCTGIYSNLSKDFEGAEGG